MFPIRVMEIKQIPRKKKPCVIKSKGEIQQYPDYEEDSDEE